MSAPRILLVSNSSADVAKLKSLFETAADGAFEVDVESHLFAALERLHRPGVDAILVDLNLADSRGLKTFNRLFAAAPSIPLMTICEDADKSLARETVKRGAHGYLKRSSLDSYLIPQALRNTLLRKSIEKTLLTERTRAAVTLEAISDAVISTDLEGNVEYLNIAAESMTGWSKNEARGRPISEIMRIVNGTTRQPGRSPVELVLELDEKMGMAADTRLIRRDGTEVSIEDSASPIHDGSGRISGAVIVFHDITATRAMATKMAHLAQHDNLTNLPNRVLLSDRITQALRLAKRRNNSIALLFIDIDNFKSVNDSRGHAIGDQLLKAISTRLCRSVRRFDTVSRQGGDEFVILLPDEQSGLGAEAVAVAVLAALAKPYLIGHHNLHVTASIGISVYPDDAKDVEELLQHADTAMYKAKEAGRDRYAFFDLAMSVSARKRQVLEHDLRMAVRENQFILHYQPIVDLMTGEIRSAEALIRWNHPSDGLRFPDEFIPTAEACGLIVQIGRWALYEACVQMKEWDSAGLQLLSIAVNVSALELQDTKFVDGVRDIINDTNIDPSRVFLEITETALILDPKSAENILLKLKDLGVGLAVDDFGTGYSSLIYLARFPIDAIKIDRSFINGVSHTHNDRVIVSAVVALGGDLSKAVIAEGIENEAQLTFLQGQKCRLGQGYLFSEPVDTVNFTNMITRGKRAFSPPSIG